MLVISRRPTERVYIGDDVYVQVIEIQGNGKVRLGISAPAEIRVDREEVRKARLLSERNRTDEDEETL